MRKKSTNTPKPMQYKQTQSGITHSQELKDFAKNKQLAFVFVLWIFLLSFVVFYSVFFFSRILSCFCFCHWVECTVSERHTSRLNWLSSSTVSNSIIEALSGAFTLATRYSSWFRPLLWFTHTHKHTIQGPTFFISTLKTWQNILWGPSTPSQIYMLLFQSRFASNKLFIFITHSHNVKHTNCDGSELRVSLKDNILYILSIYT